MTFSCTYTGASETRDMGLAPMRNREATPAETQKMLLAAAVRVGERPMPHTARALGPRELVLNHAGVDGPVG